MTIFQAIMAIIVCGMTAANASTKDLAASSAASSVVSPNGLVIHTTEMGVGKFHRYDNHVHKYDASNAWAPYVLPDDVATDHLFVQKNLDGSYTIFFTNLEEMLSAAVEISKKENRQVEVLNVHGHGLPGAMWFPPTAADLQSWGCDQWKQASAGADVDNYNQYYSAVSIDEINQIHDIADNPNVQVTCTTGVKEWTAAVQKNPDFKAIIAPDAQFHFLSCVVGLGSQGENFVKGIAGLLLSRGGNHASGRVQASMNFGLGDWSMPMGMGFWDYQSEEQVNHDNSVYPVNHKDSEIAQKGSIRMATFSGADWSSVQLSNVDFMNLQFETAIHGQPAKVSAIAPVALPPVPARVRVPGTTVYLDVH